MKARGPVTAKASRTKHPSWNETRMEGNTRTFPNREIRLKRGGGTSSGSGPSGWKLRPAKQLARSLAERKHGK